MSSTFQGNRFNRRILFYHLFAVLVVLTATLSAVNILLDISESQIHEEQLQKHLDAKYKLILAGIVEDDKPAQRQLDEFIRIQNISLICVSQPNNPLFSTKTWPAGNVSGCNQYRDSDQRISVSWEEPDTARIVTHYGESKPLISAMTITLVWFLVVILSLVFASYLIIELAERRFTLPLQTLQKSLTRFTLQPMSELGPGRTLEKVSHQVNQLINTTRQQELDLLESKDKFAALYTALQESEEYYRALFEQANEAILLLQKPNLRFSHFNHTAHKLLGYERGQFATLSLQDIVSSAESGQERIEIDAEDIPASFIANMVSASGQDRICRVNAADITIQQKHYRMLMFHDISPQRAAQRELLALNSRLQTVLDASRHLAIIAVDHHGLIEVFNKGAENILKFERTEMIGKRRLIDVIHHCQLHPNEKNASSSFQELVSSIHSDTPLTSACVYRDSDNKEIPVEQTLTRIIDNEGNHHGYLCIAMDLRERLAEQKRQDELESQLLHSQKMETIGTLAGGIAHDLNNLLTPVMGYAEMLLEDSTENEKHQRRLQRILNASLRAKELVKQILTFSHHVDHFSEPVLIKSIVKEVLELMFASLPANIQLTVDMKDPDARIFAEVTKIHQVLMNLCTNSAHAIGNNDGNITIEIDSIEYDESTGDLVLPTGKYALISVHDDGCGISKSARQRIFEPFFTTKEVGEGTGLGLSVVHGIVNSHNGTIRVKSKQNKGSSFYVYLPYYEEMEQPTTQEVMPSLGSGKRVMIVDDDEPVLQLSEELLKRKGYYVEAFTNSSKALQALRLVPDAFDVLITDQSMPELSGTELAREIRGFNATLPIIVLTGLGNILSKEEQEELGIARVVAKPVLSNDLMQIIYQVTTSEEVLG